MDAMKPSAHGAQVPSACLCTCRVWVIYGSVVFVPRLMSIQESRENGSFMVMIWLLSKYSVILMVALSLLSEQYEGSFLATKLCSQTTPVKNNPPEEEEAASRALLPLVP